MTHLVESVRAFKCFPEKLRGNNTTNLSQFLGRTSRQPVFFPSSYLLFKIVK